MTGSYQQVTLCGNLGRDPEIRSFSTGGRVCNLTLATSERWKSKDGERKERVEWHRICVFNEPLIVLAERYLKKGSKILLTGKIETRKYQKDGADHYSTEVVLRPYAGEIVLLDSKQDEGSGVTGLAPASSAPMPELSDEIIF